MDILIDWGSTNFRAFHVAGGQVIDRRNLSGHGIFKSFAPGAAQEQNYSAFIRTELAPWFEEKRNPSILMCGMVGSREGWATTPFKSLPVGFPELAASLFYLSTEQKGVLSDCTVAIVPGISVQHATGRYDVIRSEEVKALGALDHLGKANGLLSIPGTHCKWVRVKDGKVVEFHTLLTGELFGLLQDNGALAPLLKTSAPSEDPSAVLRSLELGLALSETGQDLLADIWQLRPQKLLSPNPPEDLHAYLSGILIGHELRQLHLLYPDPGPVILVSDDGPRHHFYRHALLRAGITLQAQIDNEIAVCSGLLAINAARHD